MCIPHAEQDSANLDAETSIFGIEEYADQAALDAHMATPMVVTLLADLKREEHQKHLLHRNFIASHELFTLKGPMGYTRPETRRCKDPVVVFGSFTCKPGETGKSLPGFKGLMDYCRESEEVTLTCTVLEMEEKNQLRTVEVHGKSEAVRKIGEQDRGMSKVRCRKVAGWFARE
jgi:hypothetical protein